MQEPSHLGKMFATTLIVSMILSIAILKIFGFEIGVIFAICLSVSIIATALVGVENIIIKNK